jgi:hypothetical protein
MMDDKGFIFTADAALALIVVFVFTGSIVTYTMLPLYQGEDHQHLESLASSALNVMDQSGTLREAAVDYSSGNSANATQELQTELNSLIPPGIGYSLQVGSNPPVTNNALGGLSLSNDTVTKVKVISGPQEGWMGRSYIKIEAVNFTTVNQTTVTTVWNFHNYLTNFQPWSGTGYLSKYNFWGGSGASPQTDIPIIFTIPTSGTINSAQILIGSAYETGEGTPYAYNTDFYLNGQLALSVKNSSFNLSSSPHYLYQGTNWYIFNYLNSLNTTLFNSSTPSNNNFYLRFNASQYNSMPWFSILANYTTTLSVPQGVTFNTTNFYNIAGVGNPTNSILYNISSGTATNVTTQTLSWTNLQGNDNYSLTTPFVLTNIPNTDNGNTGSGSAVMSTTDLVLPNNTNLLDAYVVLNAFGGEDGAIVQVKDPISGNWTTMFTSFNTPGVSTTQRSDGGYGNVPGIISLHDSISDPNYSVNKDPLRVGDNKVRIIIWDDANSGDYDLVGLQNCYATIAYSPFLIRWDTTIFNNYQNDSSSSTKTLTETENFNIQTGAQNVLLFMGLGTNTRNVAVKVSNGTSSNTIYNGNVQFDLNLTNYDSTNIFTTVVNGVNVPKPGNYTVSITVTPSTAYESGDLATSTGSYGNQGDPEIYSGTRISVLYPQFLQNAWATGFASTPGGAVNASYSNLFNLYLNPLINQGYYINASLIKNETVYSGNVPNAIPIRLELWKQ